MTVKLVTPLQQFFGDLCDVIRLFWGDVEISPTEGEVEIKHECAEGGGHYFDLWTCGDKTHAALFLGFVLAGIAIFGFVAACVATCVIWYLGSVAASPVIDVAANAGSLIVFLVLFIVLGIIGCACAFFTCKIGSMSLLGWASLVVIVLACFFARLVFYGMQIGVGF